MKTSAKAHPLEWL